MSPTVATSVQRPRVYLDTSAYLCIVLAEEGWQELSEKTDEAELLSSVLLVLEAKRNLIRLAREGTLKPDVYKACMDRVDADTARLVLRDLTLDLCQSGILPPVSTPRSLDLAHLRAAMWFHAAERIDYFLTTDASQQHAARELGLPA